MAKTILIFIFCAVFLIPILFGLIGTIMPAFGFLPSIQAHHFGFEVFQNLMQAPGWWQSAWYSFKLGLLTAVASLLLAFLLSVNIYQKPQTKWLKPCLAMILAMPHLPLAVGLEFLLGNHGLLFRVLLGVYPQIALIPIYATPNQIALWLTLIIKETAFLVFVMLGVFSQLKTSLSVEAGRALGYSSWQVWCKVLFLQVYPKIRLSVYAVLVFAASVVDIAIAVGSTKPSTLAVRVVQWVFHPTQIENWLLAAAGSLFIFLLSLVGVICLEALYQFSRLGIMAWSNTGRRSHKNPKYWFALLFASLWGLVLCSVLVLVVWSFAKRWNYPELFPATLSTKNWSGAAHNLSSHVWTSFSLAFLSSLLAVVLAVYSLETKTHKNNGWLGFVYLPLLVPQVGFLFGIHFYLVWLSLDGYFLTVVWVHLLFVFPYVFLMLENTYQNFDERYQKIAASLGVGRTKFFLQVKLPLISDVLLISFAVGFAVSLAQYLPTLIAGAGRTVTLATETVALSSSWNRKIISVYALLQSVLPWLMFMLVLAYTFWKKRRGF